jgi:hypothetical protein
MGRHQPAILGGLYIGVLSSLPLIGAANCCCLWVITGGMLAVYLQQQAKPEPIETGDAVVSGLIAGLVGGILACIFTYLKLLVVGPAVAGALDQVRQQLSENPQIPPGVRDTILNLIGGGGMMVIQALITIPLFAIFGMLGALLGTAFFRKKTPPVVQG